MAERMEGKRRTDWARALVNSTAFEDEQAKLGRIWTLLGLATDIPQEGDWFRATLGGRSVFVQRFGGSLRGFENVCAHRFYPLRTEDKGNGPIRCGFHHWQYNQDGLAVGIPKCQEMFGVTPRELDARLTPVEIATCGTLVFGRLSGGQGAETLEQSLGDAFAILQAMWSLKSAPYSFEIEAAANWKLLFHVSLDDYHIVAVHPDSFGKGGYLPSDAVRYYRFGRHSAYFYGGGDDALREMAEQCRNNGYHPTGYRIFNIFPNLLSVHIDAGLERYVILQHFAPLAPGRTLFRCWFSPAPFPPADRSALHGLARRISAPFVPLVFGYYARKIFREDRAACEQVQTVAHQVGKFPVLGRHEERIAWFEEAYRDVMRETTGGDQNK